MADYAFGSLRPTLRHVVAPPFRLAPAGDLPVGRFACPVLAHNADPAVRAAWLNDMFPPPDVLEWALNVVAALDLGYPDIAVPYRDGQAGAIGAAVLEHARRNRAVVAVRNANHGSHLPASVRPRAVEAAAMAFETWRRREVAGGDPHYVLY